MTGLPPLHRASLSAGDHEQADDGDEHPARKLHGRPKEPDLPSTHDVTSRQ
jgi:hypothetical protein